MKYKILNTVKLPEGFLVSGISAKLKRSGKKDLALIFSEKPASAAAVFTKNAFKAAPVLLGQERLKDGRLQAFIVNSGNANCATGEKGIKDAKNVCKELSKLLGIDEELVLMSSTGKIGQFLDVAKIKGSLGKLIGNLSIDSPANFSEAILTTDLLPKMITVECTSAGKKYTITAFSKGAGMIQPNMATMLCYIITDAPLGKTQIKKMLKESADESFNKITVDGQMSTNDTVVLMANGMASQGKAMSQKDAAVFKDAVKYICRYMAQMIVTDGEGASKFVEVYVDKSDKLARASLTARDIANSPLFKSACSVTNPNWGRIIQAVGAVNPDINTGKVSIGFYTPSPITSGVSTVPKTMIKVFDKGAPTRFSEAGVTKMLNKDRIGVYVSFGTGKYSDIVWTCDLTKEYVSINQKY